MALNIIIMLVAISFMLSVISTALTVHQMVVDSSNRSTVSQDTGTLSDVKFASVATSNLLLQNNGFSITIKAPTLTTSYSLTLPAEDGSSGQVLTTNGSGVLFWGDDDGAGSSVAGTANQILVNGTSGSAQTGALTLTLPQSIGTASSVQFSSVQSSNLLLKNSGFAITLQAPTLTASYSLTLPSVDATAFGIQAGAAFAGTGGTFIGYSAGSALTSGDGNTMVGCQAGSGGVSSTAQYDVCVGFQSGLSLTSGQYNTFAGAYSGTSNTTGYDNTAIGYCALYTNTTGAGVTALGYGAGYKYVSSSSVFVGYNAGLEQTTGLGNTMIGFEAGKGSLNSTVGSCVCIGYRAGYSLTTGNYNTLVGMDAGLNISSGDKCTFMGTEAGNSNTIGHDSTFIGHQAGKSNTIGVSNTAVGSGAGYTSTIGDNWTCVGFQAGYYNTSDGGTFVGYRAGVQHTGSSSVFVGYSAGGLLTAGIQNTMVGYEAGEGGTLSTCASCVCIGYRAGYLLATSGDNNTLVGASAGVTVTSGFQNTMLGAGTGSLITSGDRNVFIGYNAGAQAAAGTNDALYIANSNTTTPLIGGSFATPQVTITGALNVTQKIKGDGTSGVVCANAALGTSDTSGFLYIPTCAGIPSGTPTAETGTCALVYDTTNNKLYVYNGAWRSTTFA